MRRHPWIIINVIIIIIFAGLSFWTFFRSVDGVGIIQTPQVKLATLAVIGFFFLAVLLIELIIKILVKIFQRFR